MKESVREILMILITSLIVVGVITIIVYGIAVISNKDVSIDVPCSEQEVDVFNPADPQNHISPITPAGTPNDN
jgi:hypothetical protein